MVKRITAVVLMLVFVCVPLVACSEERGNVNNEELPYDLAFNNATQTYINFVEKALVDWAEAVQTYCYFPDESQAQMNASAGKPILSYEIISIKKHSDQLWEIEVFVKDQATPGGFYIAQYVALINRDYKVILNIKNIPDALKEGLELEPYIPNGPGVVDPDDIVG